MSSPTQRDLTGKNPAAGGLDTGDFATFDEDVRDFGVLDDVDTSVIGRASQCPGNVVVLRDASAWLIGRPHDGVTDVVRCVNNRANFFDLVGFQPLRVHTVEPIGVDTSLGVTNFRNMVCQVQYPEIGRASCRGGGTAR